jgi:hypothetical protein
MKSKKTSLPQQLLRSARANEEAGDRHILHGLRLAAAERVPPEVVLRWMKEQKVPEAEKWAAIYAQILEQEGGV